MHTSELIIPYLFFIPPGSTGSMAQVRGGQVSPHASSPPTPHLLYNYNIIIPLQRVENNTITPMLSNLVHQYCSVTDPLSLSEDKDNNLSLTDPLSL